MAVTKVALLGVPYDASSSYQRGSAGAPVVIREALWSEAANTWTETGLDLRESGLDDDGDLWFSDREPGSEARARIEQAVHSVLDSGRRPLLLGGDHSITYPVIRGLGRTILGSGSCTSTRTPTCMTSSRVTATPTPVRSPESWRTDWRIAWCRSASGP